MHFHKLSLKEFNALASQGVVGPHNNDFLCVGSVISGKKPIAWTNEEFGKFSIKAFSGLKCRIIPALSKLPDFYPLINNGKKLTRVPKFAVFLKNRAFKKLCRVFERRFPLSLKDECLQTHIDLGKALGYTNADIAAFVKKNYGYEKMVRILN